jgi:hypothetical protein
MARDVTEKPATSTRPVARNAFRDRNWEVLFVAFVFLVSLIATVGMVLIAVLDPQNDNRFSIIPAGALMLLVEVWLVFTLPFYGRLAFWGAIIFLATYLFFAVPFAYLGLLPGAVNAGAIIFSIISVVCGVLLFRQRELFLKPPKTLEKDKKL